jgi:hypothetical protein
LSVQSGDPVNLSESLSGELAFLIDLPVIGLTNVPLLPKLLRARGRLRLLDGSSQRAVSYC